MLLILMLTLLLVPESPIASAGATWVARYNQARQELKRGAYQASEQLGAACLAEARRRGGGDQAVVLSLSHLVEVHERLGRYRAGDSLARRALGRIGEERWPVLQARLLAVQGRCLIHRERYEAAGQALETARRLFHYYLGSAHPELADVYGPMGLLALEQEAYAKSVDYYRRALALRRALPEAPAAADAILSYQLAEAYLQQHRFTAADSLLRSAERVLRRQHPQHPELAYVYNHRARILLERSRLARARHYLERAERLQVDQLGSAHLHLAKIHLNWANYYHTSDSMVQAQARLDRAETLLRRQNMDDSALRGLVLLARSQLYDETHNAAASLGYLQRAMRHFERHDKPQEYIMCMVNKALQEADTVQAADLVVLEAQIMEAIDTLLAAKAQWEAHSFPRDLSYAYLLEQLGFLYDYYLYAYDEAEPWYLEARRVIEEVLAGSAQEVTEVNEAYGNVIKQLAVLYDFSGQPERAEPLYFQALEMDSLLFGVRHPRYIQTLSDLGGFYAFARSDSVAAEHYFRRAGRGQIDLLKAYYAFLDEKGRAEYLDNAYFYLNEFLRFGARYELSLPALRALQTLSLATKTLALDFGEGDRRRFSVLTNAEDRALLQAWQQARRQFAGAALLSREQQAAAGIDLDQERRRLREMERRLLVVSGRAAGGADDIDLPTFAGLQGRLQPGEAAVDIVRIDFHEGAPTTLYYALVTRPDRAAPALVALCQDSELAPLLTAPIFEFGDNYVESEPRAQALYELVWAPLEPWLSGIRTVRFSPAGLLHKVNFGLLRTLGDESAMLCDRLDLHYYGSLRDWLATPERAHADTTATALLLGGADYERAAGAPRPALATDMARRLPSDTFRYLPRTRSEVQAIGQALTGEGWTTTVLSDTMAGEPQLLQAVQDQAPQLLHLATHGFFYERTTAAAAGQDGRIAQLEEPLLRSGLVLAGANRPAPAAGLERSDGILTAYEVAALPLAATRLVVLSACETANGDIRNAEGVYGLQRAFKLAGADQLLLSLWQVDDESTARLMQHFYRFLLAGRPPAEALRLAQDEMRRDPYYHQPYHWGAFILLE